MEGIRLKRVEEQVRSEVAALLLRGEIKDPRVNTFLSITRVELARDGSHAKLYVSTFQDPSELEQSVIGLNKAAGYIQSALAKRIHIRLTPKLVFIADTGIKEGFELGEKLKDLLS
ncbi:MAG: 30S ribosome-binding factor RbfA [Spirochaetes bacterium]|nr:30S ribosome-binding factor RbfA [Spirochaetota bacterium]MBU0953811.1 30S ribosome-binding factor RbfA [Spirochaetota bacterium]